MNKALLVLGQHLLLASIPRHVVDASVLDCSDDVLGQDALNLSRVDARDVSFQALIPRDPAPLCVRDGDEALEDLRCAVVDLLGVANQLENVLAVGTALLKELLMGSDDGADHAGAHVALLARGNIGAARSHDTGASVVGEG